MNCETKRRDNGRLRLDVKFDEGYGQWSIV